MKSSITQKHNVLCPGHTSYPAAKMMEQGLPFTSNACMAFDLRLKHKAAEKTLFPMTI